jgi:hypothetical protein
VNIAEALRPYADSLWKRDRGCTGKKAFATRKESARTGKVWHQKAYRCPFCDKWHLSKNGMGAGGGVRR